MWLQVVINTSVCSFVYLGTVTVQCQLFSLIHLLDFRLPLTRNSYTNRILGVIPPTSAIGTNFRRNSVVLNCSVSGDVRVKSKAFYCCEHFQLLAISSGDATICSRHLSLWCSFPGGFVYLLLIPYPNFPIHGWRTATLVFFCPVRGWGLFRKINW